MECLLCLELNDLTFCLMSEDGIQQNAQAILRKYFSSCLTISDDKKHNVCLNCWQKVKEFDEFYVHIESVHRYMSIPVLALLPSADIIKLESVEPELNDIDNDFSANEDVFPPRKSKFRGASNEKDDEFVTRAKRPARPTKRSKKLVRPVEKHRTTSESEIDDPSFECGNNESSESEYETLGANDESAPRKKRKSTSNASSRSRNRTYVSDKTPQRCETCNIWLANAHKFYRHNKQFHFVLEFKCTGAQCVESYATENELAEHMKRHQRHTCPVCRKEVINLKHHRCNNSNVKLFVCEICGHTSTAKDVYNAHYEAKHMNVTYECDICGERFTNKPRIKFHMREQHVKTDKTAVCNVCGKILKNRRSLATHLPVHFEELKNRFKCSICGKGYSKKDKLKEHESIHTGVLPLQCALCDKRFRFSSSLSLHRKKEHSNSK